MTCLIKKSRVLIVITRNSIPIDQPIYETVRHGFKSVKYEGPRYWIILLRSMSGKMTITVLIIVIIKKWTPICTCHNCTLCSLIDM